MSHQPHERVDIALGERSYPILIGPHLLEDDELLSEHIAARNLLIVTNETIAPLYLRPLETALKQYRTASVVLPDGEQYKTFETMIAHHRCAGEGAHESRRGGGRARRRRHRRHGRLRRRLLSTRHRLHPGADDVAVAGGFVRRRQDRRQSSRARRT